MGSFVRYKDESIEHIARLEVRQNDKSLDQPGEWEDSIRLRMFYPLFKKDKTKVKKPKPPKHSFSPILQGVGSQQIELYESHELVFLSCSDEKDLKACLFPAFVFTLREMSLPKNAWASGLHNVYIVRFWEAHEWDSKGNKKRLLLPLPEEAALGFPNDHPDYIKCPKSITPQRCIHEAIWNGLYALKKALNKLLNKRSGQASEKEVLSLNIGHIPTEAIKYISQVANYLTTVPSHKISLSDSFFHLDHTLSRSKVKISFNAGIIRFQSQRELEILRMILGPNSTYGFSERRPTLKDGPNGIPLRDGHNLAVVASSVPQNSEERPFKMRTVEPRVDFTFSPYNVRLTVGYQRYRYSLKSDGGLEENPPCPNLSRLLRGEFLWESSSSSSSDTESDTNLETEEEKKATKQIRIGAQFLHQDDTVMEIVSITRGDGLPDFHCRCVAGAAFQTNHSVDNQMEFIRSDPIQLLADIKSFA